MELPAYRRPKLSAILRRMFDAGKAFTIRAGTIILAAMVIVWALLYFPSTGSDGTNYEVAIDRLEDSIKNERDELKQAENRAASAPNAMMRPSVTEPLRDQSFSTMPTRLLGM